MSRVYFWVFVFCLFSPLLKAQDRFYSTVNYTIKNGLPQSQVTSLLEDKNGYLWVGTHGGGLARFDGREFKVYTTLDGLLTNQIIHVKMDRHDNLWILHSRGVTKFNGRDFKRIEAPKNASMATRQMWKMYEVQDTLFILSDRDKISKLYNDSIYYWEMELKKEVRRVHVGPNGEPCFYMADGTFKISLPGKTVTFKREPKLGVAFNFFNYKGNILFRTKEEVFKLDVAENKIVKMPWTTSNFVLFYDDADDVFWTANSTGLLKEKVYSSELIGDTILRDSQETTEVLRDSEGNIWIATNGDGLYKYFVQDFRRMSPDNMRGVMAIEKDVDNSLWIGTMLKGLWKIKDGKVTSYADEKEPYRNTVNCIRQSPQGEIWVGTSFGLGRYNREKDSFQWFIPRDGLAGPAVLCMEFEENGLWIGTNNGLSFYDGKSFTNFRQKDGLNDNRVQALHYSKNRKTLYIGTPAMLNTFDGEFKSVHIPELVNAPILTLRMYRDSQLVMATGGNGTVLWNIETNQRKVITTREGLPSDFIYFTGVDDKNYLWIGSEKGINRILLDEQMEIAENLHFNDDNGLAGLETNQNAIYLTPNEKYFGLIDGLYEFNHAMDEKPRSFDLHLSDVQILYGEYTPRDYADSTVGFFKIPHTPLLPPDKNHLTFHFNRVDKRYSKSVKYKYLLENFDTKWSQPSSLNAVTYSNLPPGEYNFRVMVTNNMGSWSESKIAYPFTIKSPFYRTKSFYAGVIIFIAGMITLIFYIRVKQRIDRAMVMERIRQREQEAVRKEIARDFHDEMGNQLTRIINYISLLKLNGNGYANGAAKGSTDLYSKVEDSAKYLYSGTRDFIWSIDPVNDELSKLFLYVRDFGEKLFEEKNINFRAFNELKEEVKLPYGFCRQANLIFKEAMTNAFKYSQAKNVTLTLKRSDNDGFEMTFEDDGIGFYTGDIQKLNGLQNIRERADRINAVLRIHSEKNHGTRILLNFKPTKSLKYGATLQKTGYDRGG